MENLHHVAQQQVGTEGGLFVVGDSERVAHENPTFTPGAQTAVGGLLACEGLINECVIGTIFDEPNVGFMTFGYDRFQR